MDVCPEIVLAGVSALGAAGLLAIYIAATQNANGKRRRRRLDDYSPLPTYDFVEPLLVAGKNLLFLKFFLYLELLYLVLGSIFYSFVFP